MKDGRKQCVICKWLSHRFKACAFFNELCSATLRIFLSKTVRTQKLKSRLWTSWWELDFLKQKTDALFRPLFCLGRLPLDVPLKQCSSSLNKLLAQAKASFKKTSSVFFGKVLLSKSQPPQLLFLWQRFFANSSSSLSNSQQVIRRIPRVRLFQFSFTSFQTNFKKFEAISPVFEIDVKNEFLTRLRLDTIWIAMVSVLLDSVKLPVGTFNQWFCLNFVSEFLLKTNWTRSLSDSQKVFKRFFCSN